MARRRIRLDHLGLHEVLTSAEVDDALESLVAEAVVHAQADPAIQRHGAEIKSDSYLTDRVAYSITIAHAGGRGMEAKYGVLTRAAAAVGLEVTEGGDGLVDYVSKSGRKSRITRKQAENYRRRAS